MTHGHEHDTRPRANRNSAAEQDSPTGPFTGPVLLWLLVQLAALSVAALRFPLAAKYPQPAELLATHVMLATQVAAGALLFPYILGDWRTAAGVITAAWPFAATASVLSAIPLHTTAAAEAYVSIWLFGLALWCSALRGPRLQSYGVAVAAALTVGGALLWYLAREFDVTSSRAVGENGDLIAASPLLATLRLLTPQPSGVDSYSIPTALAAAGLLALLARRIHGRAKLSTSRTPRDQSERPITS